MDLWIRTQDRTGILKADTIFVFEKQIVKKVYGDDLVKGICLGTYATEERALEILNEIQKKMAPQFLLKENEPIKRKEIDYLCSYYRRKEINVVEVPNSIELEPINKDILVYEMPKE